MRIVFCFILLFTGSFITPAQEILVNGGAEQPIWVGWTQVVATDSWKTSNPSTDNVRAPHGGSFLFYPYHGVSATTELYQDVNVTSNSTAIDAGTASYTFSGWRRGFKNTAPFSADADRSQIIVEYRDASGTVLGSFDTGSAVFSTWTQSTDTRFAPVGTRDIRVRLISTQVSGTENDGYYDDLSLVYNVPSCTPPTSVQLIPNTTTSSCLGSSLVIAGVAAPTNSNYYYTWYQNGTAITTASQTYTSISKTTTVASDAGIYRLRVEDGNAGSATCYKESSVTIILDPPSVAGTISSSQEVCMNATIAPLTGTASTGGTAVKYYKWQRATVSATGPWIDVQTYNTTATGYAPGIAAGFTRYYRRVDSSGTCAGVATNTVTVQVNSKLVLDPITSILRDTLCIGENFQLIPHMNPLIPVSFNGGFYFTWKKVQGTTTSIVSPTSSSMNSYPASPQPATLADSGTYYLITQDGPTATQCKDSVKIVIRINQAPTKKALIQSNQEFCLGTAAAQLTELSPGTGTNGTPLYYQWYTTTDTTGTPALSKIAIASTGINYDPGTPATTTYFVRTDSVKYCAAVKTNFLKVRVNNKPILDSIRATVNDTLCENNGDQFQLKGYIDSLIAGKQSINGGFYFTWKQHQQQPVPVTYIVGTTGKYSDYPAISRPVIEADSGTYYLIVQDGINAKECLDSIALKIVVFKTCVAVTCFQPDFVSIKVASSSSNVLCTGNTLVLQKDVVTLPSTPPTFGYTYSWVRTNTLGTVVVQAASATYQDLVINSVSQIDSGRYQLIVKDGATTPTACAESSLPISVIVYKPITPAHIGNDTTICFGNAVLPFIEVAPNTGGSGSFTHQWQSSSDNIAFTNIISATNATYQSPNISTTSYFRRIDNSGTCAAISSDTITVHTSTGVNPGTIAPYNTTVCYNTVPSSPVSNTGNASGGTGGTGSDTYQWQQSADNIHWTNIAGATSLNYQETNQLTDTMYYRRKAGMGPGNCDTAYTTSVAINVSAPFTTGSIGSDQSVCSGTSVTITETIAATGYNLIYQWVESADKGKTWVLAPGPWTEATLTSPVLTDTIWYKRVAISTCEQDSSNIVKINVDTLSHPHVSINDGLTCQSTNIQLTAVASNAGLTPAYIWQKASSISGPWTTITAATTADYLVTNPQPIDSGTVYKVIVTSSDICNIGPDDTTVVLRVRKSIQPTVSIQANPSGAVCDTLQSITYNAVSTGGGTAPTYQWYNGTTNGAFTGATNTTYTSSSSVNGDNVFIVMTSNASCATPGTATSTTFVLNLVTTPNPTILAVDTTICTPNNILLHVNNTAASGNTFQWYKDGNPITGATGTTYLVSSSDIPGGIYTFKESNGACAFATITNATVVILETPTVSAGNDETVQKNSIVTFQGSVSGSANYSWTPSTGLSNANILNPDATITHTVTYILSAHDATGKCSAQSSVTITVADAIKIPNVITPNGDGVNDVWNIEHIENFPNATFIIYNRWGNIVWKAGGNVFQWNGTNYRNGELLADGTYFYVIDLQSNSYPEPYTGYIQLIK